MSDGFDKDLRYSFGLGQNASAYKFLNQGGKITNPEIDDTQGVIDTLVRELLQPLECFILAN